MEGMASLDHLKDVVTAGVAAPSPDNNQPWRFRWQQDALTIFLDRSQALPSDVRHMFDLMSAGAVIENISVAATQYGLTTEIEPLWDPDNSTEFPQVAQVRFFPGAKPDLLAQCISNRCTNRLLYSKKPLSDQHWERLKDAVAVFPDVHLHIIADRGQLKALARLVMLADRFRFEYPAFHAEIFRQLRFTAEEAERTRDGLDFRTLALPPGSKFLIKALRSWSLMSRLNRLGLSRALTWPSYGCVLCSGGAVLLSVPEFTFAHILAAGRAFERLWLVATQHGLALHPLGSLPIFIAHEEILDGVKLTPQHRQLARRLASSLRELEPSLSGRVLMMVARLGYGPPCRVRSLRRPVESSLKDDEHSEGRACRVR